MNNDLYEDLTDEEKALLKRETKHRIEQQRSREKSVEDQLPGIIIGMALLPLSVGLMVAASYEWLFILMLTLTILMILFAVGVARWQRYKGSSDNKLKNRSTKNKRG